MVSVEACRATSATTIRNSVGLGKQQPILDKTLDVGSEAMRSGKLEDSLWVRQTWGRESFRLLSPQEST